MQAQRDAQQRQNCVSNAFSAWCSINPTVTHTMLRTQNVSTPPAALLRKDGKKRHQILHVFNITVFGVFFFSQIDHKSTCKNSKPVFLLLVPLLSFDFFFNTLFFLYVCAWLFFPLLYGKNQKTILQCFEVPLLL